MLKTSHYKPSRYLSKGLTRTIVAIVSYIVDIILRENLEFLLTDKTRFIRAKTTVLKLPQLTTGSKC